MIKKLTKTIILIVFVVFLGINKVNAAIFKTCAYKNGDKNVTVTISKSFVASVSTSSYNNLKKIGNWDVAGSDFKSKSSFLGYNYFKDNNRTCPPVVMVVQYTMDKYLFFSDDTSKTKKEVKAGAEKMKKLFDFKVDELALASELDGDSHFGEDTTPSSIAKVTSKTCQCEGTQGNDKIKITFDVNPNLVTPAVEMSINDKDASKNLFSSITIENWNKAAPGTSYTYYDDLVKNNSCPAYALLEKTNLISTKYVYLSDQKNLSKLKSVSKSWWGAKSSVYAVDCKEIKKQEEEKPTTPTEPEKEYEDPSVEHNVDRLNSDLDTFSCGNNYVQGIPARFIRITKFLYNFIQVLVPVVIVILGILDLVKSIAGQKEDEIKKGQQTFIKRLIGAVVVFFVFAIIKFLVSILSSNSTEVISCMDCFLKGNDSCILE